MRSGVVSAATRSDEPQVRGPGWWESVGWMVGYWLVQLVAAASLVLILIWYAFEGWPDRLEPIEDVLFQLSGDDLAWLSVYVTGGATLGALFVIVPIVFLRLRPAPRNALGTHCPAARQLVLLAGAVLPLAMLSDELYRAASLVWGLVRSHLAATWPVIEQFSQLDTIDLIQIQTSQTAYPLLLVIIGVGPAIGEELVFRGVIGRGLVHRYGTFWGVLLTSLLFAEAHGTPAHAVATLPIAVFLHLTYLATRTIWAPILVHFLNNALSVTMLKYRLGENVSVSWVMLACAAIYVTAIGMMIWQTRPGRDASTAPPRLWSLPGLAADTGGSGGSFAVATPSWLTLLATTGVLGFTWTFVAAAMGG